MKRWSLVVILWFVPSARADLRSLLDAIREVESGNDPSQVGDDGRSLGPYQIQWAYWRDSGVPGVYTQVRDPRYAERVMIGYWKRYCPEALARCDYQTLARVHNGGHSGARKAATLYYWQKVSRELRERPAPAAYVPARGRFR